MTTTCAASICRMDRSDGTNGRETPRRTVPLIVLEDADRLLERNRERSSCVLCDVRQRLLRP
jgi:hypothetical protein